jgi:hypothetical protein
MQETNKPDWTDPSDVATGNDAGSAHEGSTDVRDDSTVQVGHNHDIELPGFGNELH